MLNHAQVGELAFRLNKLEDAIEKNESDGIAQARLEGFTDALAALGEADMDRVINRAAGYSKSTEQRNAYMKEYMRGYRERRREC